MVPLAVAPQQQAAATALAADRPCLVLKTSQLGTQVSCKGVSGFGFRGLGFRVEGYWLLEGPERWL